MNNERKKENLKPLKESPELNMSAKIKAESMFKEGYWAHVSPEGVEPWDLFGKAGYSYHYAGENLARLYDNAESAVEGWMLSQGHRENILSDKYTETGVFVGNGAISGLESLLIVQHFGTPYETSSDNNSPRTPSRTGRIISYTEWCTGKQIKVYENEIIIKKTSDGKTLGMTVDDWNCYEKTPDETLLYKKTSRSGNIIPYHEWCTGRDISIYENEKVYRKLPDGKIYWLTADDWKCYDQGMPKK